MLKETLGRGDGPGEPDPEAAGTAEQASAPRQPGSLRARLSGLPQLIRENRLFSAALAVAIIPRIIVMLGFQPAVLFKLDSYDYLWDAVHLQPNPVNPNGYSH
jgi:hypothetical protein